MVPGVPPVGVKEDMVGAGMNVNPANVPVPPEPVTDTLPLAPEASVAIILVADATLKLLAATPPKLTAVMPAK